MYRVMCDVCNKKPAIKKVDTYKKDKKYTSYLCEDCYHKRQQDSTISIMKGLAGNTGKPITYARENVCRKCGTTASEFLRTGILGCDYCYNDLAPEISSVIQQSQGKIGHTGKSPNKSVQPKAENTTKIEVEPEPPETEENEVLTLKKQLESAILVEDFEQACELRDKINALEAEGDDDA